MAYRQEFRHGIPAVAKLADGPAQRNGRQHSEIFRHFVGRSGQLTKNAYICPSIKWNTNESILAGCFSLVASVRASVCSAPSVAAVALGRGWQMDGHWTLSGGFCLLLYQFSVRQQDAAQCHHVFLRGGQLMDFHSAVSRRSEEHTSELQSPD